ncbi:MAG: DUF6147 family protein [Candidatus Choladocola sp.]|nr:DUF6147 family protein [Candidatus Choladocola sp.]
MRIRKKTIMLFSLLVCLIMSTTTVFAADERVGTVVDGSVLTDGTEAEGFFYPKARGSILASGSGDISIVGGRTVKVSGDTTAYRTVSKVKVTLYLQQLQGGNWVTVRTLGPKTNYNSYYVSNSNTYSVAGGYYYRVYGGHTAIDGSTSEAGTSYTDGVWVP